jgi:hypothetical protein
MFKDKKKAKENFEWTAWIAGGIAALGGLVVTACSAAVKILDKQMEDKK